MYEFEYEFEYDTEFWLALFWPAVGMMVQVSGGRQKAEEFEAEDAETQALPDKKGEIKTFI